jgi:hypothetical protein
MVEIAARVHANAQAILAAPADAFVGALNKALSEILGDAITCRTGFMLSQDGSRSDVFQTVLSTSRQFGTEPQSFPADETAAVVDVSDVMDLSGFRSAYGRIGAAKRLLKTSVTR